MKHKLRIIKNIHKVGLVADELCDAAPTQAGYLAYASRSAVQPKWADK